MDKETQRAIARELLEQARELRELADHPENKANGERWKALRYAAKRLGDRAFELDPFRPRKYS